MKVYVFPKNLMAVVLVVAGIIQLKNLANDRYWKMFAMDLTALVSQEITHLKILSYTLRLRPPVNDL
jgi:hypothetical protein